MKSNIEYYYNIEIDSIKNYDNNYVIESEDKLYYFLLFNREEKYIMDLYNINMELKSKLNNVTNILFNINNELITKIDNNNFILLNVSKDNKKLDLIDIVDYSKKLNVNSDINGKYKNNWDILWENKIDYIEKQLTETFVDNVISSSIDYYLGLTENAISIVKRINKENIEISRVVLSHERLLYPIYENDYFNPIEYIFDIEVRDVAEYLKSMFFKNQDAFFELKSYLSIVKLNDYNYKMLFARLLYPSYYFDLYEKVFDKKIKSEELLKVIKLSDTYEEFIKKAYYEISQYAILDKIEWIIY